MSERTSDTELRARSEHGGKQVTFWQRSTLNWKSGFLELDEQRGFQAEFLNFFARVKLQDGTACARALHSRDAIIAEDVMVDPHFARCRGILERAGVRAVQSTPLISSSGALVGILSTHFATPSRPTDQQMLAIRNASQLVANAIIDVRMRAASDRIESSMRLMGESQQVLATAEKILSRTC